MAGYEDYTVPPTPDHPRVRVEECERILKEYITSRYTTLPITKGDAQRMFNDECLRSVGFDETNPYIPMSADAVNDLLALMNQIDDDTNYPTKGDKVGVLGESMQPLWFFERSSHDPRPLPDDERIYEPYNTRNKCKTHMQKYVAGWGAG